MSNNRENRTPGQTMMDLVARIQELEAMVPRWIKIEPGCQMPQGEKPVRVIWSCPCHSDRQTAIWHGTYWGTSRGRGYFCDYPDHWLYVPALPEPPKEAKP